jgi:large-conductance mechanosensitive channel
MKKKEEAQPEAPTPSATEKLLVEIRDLLKSNKAA